MARIIESDQEILRRRFEAELIDKVRLVHFSRPQPLFKTTGQGQYSLIEAGELLETVAGLSDKIELEIHNLDTEESLAGEYGIDKIPATAVVGAEDYGVRHFGTPGGRQFASFVQAIVDVSRRTGGVSQATKDALQQVDVPVHIQVFVSPG